MNAHNLILEALDSIFAFNVADDLLGDVLTDQAGILAGISPDDIDQFVMD